MKSEIILHDHSVTFETNEPVVEKDGLVVNIVGGIGPRGTKGDTGDTPVKGVDYFTEEDIDEIADAAAGKVHVPSNVSELVNDAGYLTEHQDISGKADKDEIPTRVSELENDAGYLTEHQDVSGKADKSELPTRVSELENDAGYLTAHQDISQKADKSEIPTKVSELENDSGYLTMHQDISQKADKSEIPVNVSELVNDAGYLTEHQDISQKADKSEIPTKMSDLSNDTGFITSASLPTKVSQLQNDTGYLTEHQDISGKADKSEIPVNVSELVNDAGYLTEYQDVSNKAEKSEIPTKVSELENDTGYITGYTETDPTVPEWAKRSVKPSYMASEVGALPDNTHIPSTTGELENDAGFITADDLPINVSELVNDAGYLTQHQDISSKADKSEIPVNVSQLTNDAGYLTEHQDISSKADKTEIPTKVSELTNDSGYLTIETDPTVPAWAKAAQKPAYTATEVGALPSNTHIPSTTAELTNDAGFITSASLPVNISVLNNDAGYLTEHQDISGKADKTEIPTKVSDLTNDSGYLTTESDPTVPAWAKASTKPSYTAAEVGAVTEQRVSEMIADAAPEVPVQDVQVNGASILQNGVANVPVASISTYGVARVNRNMGVGIMTSGGNIGTLELIGSASSAIKNGTNSYTAIVPARQHEAVFYGLAKAAGDTSQSVSSNTVGTYTDEAKTAIQNMLDVPSNTDLAQAISDVEEKIQHMYICSAAEYNSETGVPTVVNPDSKMFYLVPSAEGSPNLYIEWVYLNDAWERFGSATVDLSNYVQFDDYATASKAGVVKTGGTAIDVNSNGQLYVNTNSAYGVRSYSGTLAITDATVNEIKTGTTTWKSLTPGYQHASAFYGLAKAAGDTTQSASSNAVGIYTDNAKASIKSMLGIQDGSTGTVDVSGTAPVIAAVENTRYVCGEVTTLTITPPSSGICIVRFTSGSTPTVLTANNVIWPDWFDSTELEVSRVYEICITDGYGAVMSWPL